MPKKSRSQPPRRPPLHHVINPTAVYSVEGAQMFLHLRKDTVRNEVRAGRLKVARRANRYYLLGSWILEWLEAGVYQPRRKAVA